MSNEIILFQILYNHLEHLLFSVMNIRIIKSIQCGPCFINGLKFPEILFFEIFYIVIEHLVLVMFIHFMYINI
jgi:hypothetical protein